MINWLRQQFMQYGEDNLTLLLYELDQILADGWWTK